VKAGGCTILEVVISSTLGQAAISFTEQDLEAFSEASGDRNPLHLSHQYARRTPYGQPVVFGCLGAMACLGHIHLPAGWSAIALEAEFLRPMFLGVEHRVETSQKDDQWTARLFDGKRPVVSVKVTAKASREEVTPEATVGASVFERGVAAARQPEHIVAGLKISGVYACNAAALAAVAARWGVADRLLATVLSWSSYLVGMELPGESALWIRGPGNSKRRFLWLTEALPLPRADTGLTYGQRYRRLRRSIPR
jgi:acyl dehydratase